MDHPLNPQYPNRRMFVSYADLNGERKQLRRTRIALNVVYSLEAKKKLREVILAEKPDIVHLHNFAHQISPSILPVLKELNIPTIMTMHDFKLACGAYGLSFNGKFCEKCSGGRYYQCFLNKCIKNSMTKSLLITLEMYLHHRILHSYDQIKMFISPSLFLKEKLRELGFHGPTVHLPNFIKVDKYEPAYGAQENSIVYFGRLIAGKGLSLLLRAAENIDNVGVKIIGEGPLRGSLEGEAKGRGLENIRFLGYLSGEELKAQIKKSLFAVLPSEHYENYPLSIIESFALGKPAVASRIGGVPELVKDNVTGLTFEPNNVLDLELKIREMLASSTRISEMGKNARAFVERELNQEKHYDRLMTIYHQAILENRSLAMTKRRP